MASVLVHVRGDDLAALVGEGPLTPGRHVPLKRELLPPQIERLDDEGTPFLVSVIKARAIVVATFENGEGTLHDHDISGLLTRLGCAKVWDVPTFRHQGGALRTRADERGAPAHHRRQRGWVPRRGQHGPRHRPGARAERRELTGLSDIEETQRDDAA